MLKQFSTALLILSASAASADEVAVVLKSRTMLAHWQCHVYAELMEDEEGRARHFDAGFLDGMVFMDGFKKNKISDKTLGEDVPWIVSGDLEGPSSEFILGRVYKAVRDHTSDRVYTTTRTKGSLGPVYEAEKEYLNANCALIR